MVFSIRHLLIASSLLLVMLIDTGPVRADSINTEIQPKVAESCRHFSP